ncbi:cyclic phosphodiesterase-like [Senna tora]|uniref:Cyclic phosphodiesterase-like n=1 Tax=Senna tora TaxID=362788 RepID=A0A834SQM2_9FABA|nr:cyclic phosphodiesterase-like [Senna tora]
MFPHARCHGTWKLKTVMTIALILARPSKVSSENKDGVSSSNSSITKKRKKGSHISFTADDALNKFRSVCEGLKAYDATGTFFYQCV